MMGRHGLSVRGDSLYCPLSFSLDSYWNCLNDCWHCYLRRLNHTWGTDLRPTDPEETRRKLERTRSGKSPLNQCILQKKTIRFGNKADPFQPAEREHRVSRDLLEILSDLDWSAVIQTMCTEVLMDYRSLIVDNRERFIVQAIISPGMGQDWEVLERRRTTPVEDRLDHLVALRDDGVEIGVNGEPFIPGYHTPADFERTILALKERGIDRYNTYNLHLNWFVADRLASIGLDVERIWREKQDDRWRETLRTIIEICDRNGIRLGCPDFVNSGDHVEPFNTCCGIDVPSPTTFNAINWKRRIQKGEDPERVFRLSWDGIGDRELGQKVFDGTTDEMYTLKDAGLRGKKEGLWD